MIKQETVLTATSIVLERVNNSKAISDECGPLIHGLNQSVLSLEGYTLGNLAVDIPKNTGEGSEHTVLVDEAANTISAIVRASLGVIGTHIIPACDIIERSVKEMYNKNQTVDYLFRELRINPTYLNSALLNSPVFQIEPDADFQAGVAFKADTTKMGSWPELTAPEIANLCKEALSYPELVEVFSDEETVLSGYRGVHSLPYWLFNNSDTQRVHDVKLEAKDLHRLIVTNVILHKLDSMEQPLDGVDGISLEDYRTNISRLKRFVKTVLFRARSTLEILIARGIEIVNDKVKYEVCKDGYSPFDGMKVLCGEVDVIYTKEIEDFFEASDSASLTEVVAGMVLLRKLGKDASGENFIARVPGYMGAWKDYLMTAEAGLTANIRKCATRAINDAIQRIATESPWKEFLEQSDGPTANVVKLQKALVAAGGYIEVLSAPTFIADVIDGRQRIAASIIAPRLAKVLGVPLAEKVLLENINEDCSCQEKQRKALSRAMVKVVIEYMMK